eukprot:5955204-Pyramimonas_sp.AAC.1
MSFHRVPSGRFRPFGGQPGSPWVLLTASRRLEPVSERSGAEVGCGKIVTGPFGHSARRSCLRPL